MMKKAVKEVVKRLKAKKLDKNILCAPFWNKLLRIEKLLDSGDTSADSDAWGFLKENAQWAIVNGVITKSDFLDWFSMDELEKNGFYFNKEVELNNFFGVLFDCQAKVTGHSHVSAFGDLTNIVAFDTSCINIFGGFIEAKDCFVFAFWEALVNMSGYGKVEAFDNTNVTLTGFSYLLAYDKCMYIRGGENVRVIEMKERPQDQNGL